jgi:polysaccharide export outer membrane protein
MLPPLWTDTLIVDMKLWLKAVSALFCAAGACAAQSAALPIMPQGAAVQSAAPDNQEPPPVKKPSVTPAAPAPVAPAPADPQTDPKPYVIGPLDVIYVKVWNNQNLTGMMDVGPDGMISLPLIGQLRADGLTVQQLKETIATRLNDYLLNPEVSVDVTRINSKRYYILGGVNRPGPFPLSVRTTVSEALSNAGGFSGFANQKKIYVLRGTKKILFNYKDVIAGKHLEQDITLENGDKIVVPE